MSVHDDPIDIIGLSEVNKQDQASNLKQLYLLLQNKMSNQILFQHDFDSYYDLCEKIQETLSNFAAISAIQNQYISQYYSTILPYLKSLKKIQYLKD